MTPRPNTIFPHTWNHASAGEKKEYVAESTRVNKNRDDARSAREIEWERVPFEDCETDYQFNLTPIAYNSKKWDDARAMASYGRQNRKVQKNTSDLKKMVGTFVQFGENLQDTGG